MSSCMWAWRVGVLVLWVSVGVSGHGRLMEPPARSSAWRYGFDTPVNYNDNELFCGGVGIHYGQNDGKCGVCGDPWDQPRPRDNEAGGYYGKGVIVANYTMNQELTIAVELTTNHLGYFEFRLCVNNNPLQYIEQECLDEHLLQMADGSGTEFPIHGDDPKWHYTPVILPKDLVCSQCVLQWHYQTGNSWGDCGNGTSALGCGPQEWFRGCADIAILDPASQKEK